MFLLQCLSRTRRKSEAFHQDSTSQTVKFIVSQKVLKRVSSKGIGRLKLLQNKNFHRHLVCVYKGSYFGGGEGIKVPGKSIKKIVPHHNAKFVSEI